MVNEKSESEQTHLYADPLIPVLRLGQRELSSANRWGRHNQAFLSASGSNWDHVLQPVKGQKHRIGEELSSWEIQSTKCKFEKIKEKEVIKNSLQVTEGMAVEVRYFVLLSTVSKAISSLRK